MWLVKVGYVSEEFIRIHLKVITFYYIYKKTGYYITLTDYTRNNSVLLLCQNQDFFAH